ncbi:response regulator [Micromonospora sp. NPDC050397]|uniref:response regulator n=1 Tax=Micromonospora sp. NPDC050397 TaxID=3364279 RepID=UPI0038513B45
MLVPRLLVGRDRAVRGQGAAGYTAAPRPDPVLLDLNMPRTNGRETLREIKSDPGLKAIPVVVFTTPSVDTDVLASYGEHADAYVTEPIDLDDFDRVVQEIEEFYGRTVTRPKAD